MKIDEKFEDAIHSKSYDIIKEYIIDHQEDWIKHKEWNQEKFAEIIQNNTQGITVCFATVCVYTGDILKRLGIKERYSRKECDVPYKEEELKEILGGDQLSFNITMMLIRNIHITEFNEDDFQEMYNINRQRLGEDRYKKCMGLDKDRLRCGYIIGKNGRKCYDFKQLK